MKKAKKPRRQYHDEGGNKLPSVTTILGAAVAKQDQAVEAVEAAAAAAKQHLSEQEMGKLLDGSNF